MKKVLIFASGAGSNFDAIVKHFINNGFACFDKAKASVCGQKQVYFELISDKKDANALKIAQKYGIKHHFVQFDRLYDFIKASNDWDLYVLAGFMRILPKKLLDLMGYEQNKILNIHPSLLPEFKGKNAIERVFEAGVSKTGVTVHFVDENLDGGKIIERRAIETSGLSLNALVECIHGLEHSIYPKIIENLLFKKNVLVFGGGAREHALAQKISLSPYLGQLYLAKPNDGFKNLGKVIEFSSYDELLTKAVEFGVDLLVVGPENPLFDGIADIFNAAGIETIGANKAWARLEKSKFFAKEFMQKYASNTIKTADFRVAKNLDEAKDAIDYFQAKNAALPVIKADGPALGKGVYLPKNYSDAIECAKAFLDGQFGEASRQILIEERLFGVEISVMSLWDGKTLLSFPPASDYKRLLDDNIGPNTGGMGSYAPSKISLDEKKQLEEYLKNLECALKASGADFCGVIYSGLILTPAGIWVLEYNMRFGDPEIQALLELLDDAAGCDLLDIFIKMTQKRLDEANLWFKRGNAYCLTLAAQGYPSNPKKGAEISGIKDAIEYGCKIYFAGVKAAIEGANSSGGAEFSLVTNGGRVMSIVKADDIASNFNNGKALADIYRAAEKIQYEGKIYRRDIAK